MANLLIINREINDYFTFTLNGDVANAIKNTRNDLTIVASKCHFKTSNGANLIKEQDIDFSNVTITDGVISLVPTSQDDLFTKLISVNFFGWINPSGGGGVVRFDELEDTFSYFGKDGYTVKVDEAQLKLIPVPFPNLTKLDKFPNSLVANKMLRVNSSGTAYEYIDTPSPSSLLVIPYDFPKLLAPQQDFIIPSGKTAIRIEVNGTPYNLLTTNNTTDFNTFTQSGITITTKDPLEIGNYIIIYIQ